MASMFAPTRLIEPVKPSRNVPKKKETVGENANPVGSSPYRTKVDLNIRENMAILALKQR